MKAIFCAALAAAALAPPQARSAPVPPIFAFNATVDGVNPLGGLSGDAAGNLYGATLLGGATCTFNPTAGCGVVFELSPPGKSGGAWTETVLHNFVHYYTDGAEPAGGVISDAAGNLYGTTIYGSAVYGGIAFRLSPPGAGQTAWTETVLHAFAGTGDGFSPQAGLAIDAAGALYGTTFQTNQNGGCGAVFRLTPPGAGKTAWKQTTLYNFTGGTDGCASQAKLTIGANGALFGTTTSGGASGAGSVFQLTPAGGGAPPWTETTLYEFPASGGSGTGGGLAMDTQGALYVTTATAGGGACKGGCGQVIKLTPQQGGGWTPAVIYTFQGGTDGRHPVGTLVFDASGNLYGATRGHLALPGGTVFKLSPPGSGNSWTLTTLYHFTNKGDGAAPNAGVFLGADGAAFGTMGYGGSYGAVFGIAP